MYTTDTILTSVDLEQLLRTECKLHKPQINYVYKEMCIKGNSYVPFPGAKYKITLIEPNRFEVHTFD